MIRTRACLVLTAALLSTSACGGDDGLSKEEFISQGDAICSQLEKDTDAIPEPTEEAAFAPFITQVIDLVKGARTDFAALDAPEDGEQVKQQLLDSIDTSIATAEGAATAAEQGDIVTAGDLLTQAAEEGAVSDQAARDYGFKTCGSES